MRALFLLVVCSGCDLVIPISEREPARCGPYKSITPVVFDEVLQEPRDFSVDYEGLHGMVYARVPLGTGTYTGPVPITLVDDVWRLDSARYPSARERNIAVFDLDGGHMLGDGTVFGWKDAVIATGATPQINRYKFVAAVNPANSRWSLDGTDALESDFTRNLRPGNEIVLPLDPNGMLRVFPQVRVDYQTGKRNQLVIRQKYGTMPWLATNQGDKLASFEFLEITAAAMTLDHELLVYAASENGGKSRIFTSPRDGEDQFVLGRRVDLDSDDDLDETEPWIAQDCSVMYFRRGGITYRAQ